MTTLISIGDLLSKGFKAIQDTWRPTLKYTIWFLLAPGLWYSIFLGSMLGSLATTISESVVTGSPFSPVLIVFWSVSFFVMLVGLFYAYVCLTQYMLAYAKGENMANWKPKNPLSYLPGMLWLYVLTCVPVFVAGFIAVIPSLAVRDENVAGWLVALLMAAATVFIVWLSIAFSQAHLLLLTDEARGIAALKGSMELVNGRWWKTLWRIFVPSLVFSLVAGMIVWAVFMLMFVISFVFLGGWAAIMSVGGAGAESGAAAGFGVGSMIMFGLFGLCGIVLALAHTVTQVIFQADVSARLFWSLKHSKHATK